MYNKITTSRSAAAAAVALALACLHVPLAADPIPAERIVVERPADADGAYRVAYLGLRPAGEGAGEGAVEGAVLPQITLAMRGDRIVTGLLPGDVYRTAVSDLKLAGSRITGTIADQPEGGPRGRVFLYTLDATIGQGGDVTGTFTFDHGGGDATGRGDIDGIVKSEADLEREQAFADGADWPSYRGPFINYIATPTDAELVEDLHDARLVWKSEAFIPGAPGRSGGMFRKALGVPTTPVTGGGATPIFAQTPEGPRIYLRYFYPSGEVVDAKAEAQLIEKFGPNFNNRDKIRVAADDLMLCVDAVTGKTLWKTTLRDAGLNYQDHKGSQNNLAAVYHDDGGEGRVFMIGSTMRLYALNAATGEVLWQNDLGPRHRQLEEMKAKGLAARNYQGRAQSRDFGAAPLMVAKVLVTPDVNNDLLGFNPETGELMWRLTEGAARDAQPSRWTHGDKEYVISAGKQKYDPMIRAVDPATGEVLWALKHEHRDVVTVAGDLMAFASANKDVKDEAYRHHAFRLSPEGASELWTISDPAFGDAPPIIHEGVVYLGGRGVTAAVDAESGKELARAGAGPGNSGHYQMMQDRILVSRDGKHGRTSLDQVRAEVERFEALGEENWQPAHPLTTSYEFPMSWPTVDGRIVIRGWDAIYLYDLRQRDGVAMTPEAGQYEEAVRVELAPPHADWTVRYTLDNTKPTAASPEYQTPIEVGETTILKAWAFDGTGRGGPVSQAVYYFGDRARSAAPEVTPAAGEYDRYVSVELSSPTRLATVRYTLDGSDPGAGSEAYDGPITVEKDATVKARSFVPHLPPSDVAVAEYRIVRRPFVEEGGRVVLEAEEAFANIARDEQSWQRVEDEAAGGGVVLVAGPDRGRKVTSPTGPELVFPIRFQTPGTYRVWARWSGGRGLGADDSFHIGLDRKLVGTMSGGGGEWAWQHEGDDGPVNIKVDEPGEHTLHIWMREDGTRLDRLMLTTDARTPEGEGPAVSKRSGE